MYRIFFLEIKMIIVISELSTWKQKGKTNLVGKHMYPWPLGHFYL